MDRRWAPAGAAVAVALLVGAVTLVLGGDDGPGTVATLPAPSAQASPAPQPPTAAPRDPVTTPAPRDPDTPVSSDDEPTPAPAASEPAPAKTTTPAPAPARTRTAAPQPTPASSPAGDRAPFSFDAAYGTDEPYEVVVQYGDSSSCPHRSVTHAVRESAEQVVVTLEAQAQDPDRACTADYRQMLVPVRLQQPLGDRVLIDGSRNEQVAVDRSCNRPFDNPPPPKNCEP